MGHKKTTKQYIEEANLKHNFFYSYDATDYIGAKSPITITCPIHGNKEVQAANHLNGSGCNECGKKKSIEKRRLNKKSLLVEFSKTHNNKYDYSKVEYFGLHSQIKIICPVHGDFFQEANVHKSGSGCTKCGIESKIDKLSMSKDEFITKLQNVHGNKYDYKEMDISDGIANTPFIKIKCKKHNHLYSVSTRNHLNNAASGCKHCRSLGPSLEEIELFEFIRSIVPSDIKIIQNDRSLIRPKEIDILIPAMNIAFEYCGIYWHSEKMNISKKYHLEKTKKCNAANINLIHIFNNEWLKKNSIVKSRIRNLLKCNTIKKLNARDLKIKRIDNKVKSSFLIENHIQGDVPSNINYGLYDINNELLTIMTFGKSRYNKSADFELLRLASKTNTVVRGGASKLFNAFIKEYNPISIVSYSDKRWNNGVVYKTLGFNYINSSSPNYFYFKDGSIKLESRIKYQKHKLRKMLKNYDSNKTEWENMKINGYNRIWDCGNDVFMWHNKN